MKFTERFLNALNMYPILLSKVQRLEDEFIKNNPDKAHNVLYNISLCYACENSFLKTSRLNGICYDEEFCIISRKSEKNPCLECTFFVERNAK